MYVSVNNEGVIEVFAEEHDKCFTCGEMKDCPLMAALQTEVVILHYEAINIEDCGIYKEMENTCDGRARAL